MGKIDFASQLGDIWDLAKTRKSVVVVPVNLCGVFGRGIAKQAADKYPGIVKYFKQHLPNYIDKWCRGLLHTGGVRGMRFFPVKYDWKDRASLDLICSSAYGLVESITHSPGYSEWLIPHVGCGFGELDWFDVKQVLLPILRPVHKSVVIVTPPHSLRKKYPKAFAAGYRKDKL